MGYDRYSTLLGVEDSLRQIRFEPRASLEAELLWQVRGKAGEPDPPGRVPDWGLLAVVAAGLAAVIFIFWTHLLTLAGSR